MAVAEGFRRLRRIGRYEAGVRVRQVKGEEVELAVHPADDPDRLPKVGLRMPRWMHQRHKHLPRPLPPAGHVILHDRDAAREAVLVAQPFEYPLRRVLLLLRSTFVRDQDRFDNRDEGAQLRLRRRLRPPIARRYGELQHLVDGPRINPKPSRNRPLA